MLVENSIPREIFLALHKKSVNNSNMLQCPPIITTHGSWRTSHPDSTPLIEVPHRRGDRMKCKVYQLHKAGLHINRTPPILVGMQPPWKGILEPLQSQPIDEPCMALWAEISQGRLSSCTTSMTTTSSWAATYPISWATLAAVGVFTTIFDEFGLPPAGLQSKKHQPFQRAQATTHIAKIDGGKLNRCLDGIPGENIIYEWGHERLEWVRQVLCYQDQLEG